MIRKLELFNKAVSLRQKGFSYNEILEVIPVGHGTISRWCSTIILTEEQKKRLNDKHKNNSFIVYVKEKAAKSKENAEAWANNQLNKITIESHNLLLISGLLLYWAEGTKNRHSLAFTNTDSEMIKLMMNFFRTVLNVPESKFRIMIRIGSMGDVERAKNYWLEVTNLSTKNLRRAEILTLKPNSKSLEKYPYGMCRIEINSADLSRKVNTLMQKFIKSYKSSSFNG